MTRVEQSCVMDWFWVVWMWRMWWSVYYVQWVLYLHNSVIAYCMIHLSWHVPPLTVCSGLDGSTCSTERDNLVTSFNSPNNEHCWVFLLSTRWVGTLTTSESTGCLKWGVLWKSCIIHNSKCFTEKSKNVNNLICTGVWNDLRCYLVFRYCHKIKVLTSLWDLYWYMYAVKSWSSQARLLL